MEETIFEEPKEHIVLKGTKVIPSRGSGQFAWPFEGGYILVRWVIVGVVSMRE